MGKSIKELDYSIQAKAQTMYEEMNRNVKLKELHVEQVAIVETKRELTTQMAYYSRGRMKPEDVRRMYAAAGLHDLTEIEARTVNTNTLYSNHLKGRAIDLCPVKDGKLWWNAPKEVWNLMGEIGESCGFKWGGRWKDFPDSPHFES